MRPRSRSEPDPTSASVPRSPIDPSAVPAWSRPLALGVLSLAFGLLATEACRDAPRGPDRRVAAWIEEHRRSHPGVTRSLLAATRLGDWPTAGLVTAATGLVIALAARKEPPRRRACEPLFHGAAVASSWMLGTALKQIVRRDRPPMGWLEEPGFSFPSGHSLFGTVCFGLLAVAIWKLSNLHLGWRVAVAAACLGLIAALAASRVWLGVHYLSDVTGGVALGLGWVILSWSVHEAWSGRSGRPIA